MTAHAARRQPSYFERVVTLEEQRKADVMRMDKIEKSFGTMTDQVDTLYNLFMAAKGIRWLLIVIGGFVGLTAATVTASIALVRFITGH